CRKLLLRWAEEAPAESRTSASTWLAARGLKSLWDSLRDTDIPYLVTGSAVAAGIAPVAPTRLASVYVEDPEGAAAVLGLQSWPFALGTLDVLMPWRRGTSVGHVVDKRPTCTWGRGRRALRG